jgi:hypothetical protein
MRGYAATRIGSWMPLRVAKFRILASKIGVMDAPAMMIFVPSRVSTSDVST